MEGIVGAAASRRRMRVLMLGWELPPFFVVGVGIVAAALADL